MWENPQCHHIIPGDKTRVKPPGVVMLFDKILDDDKRMEVTTEGKDGPERRDGGEGLVRKG